MNTISKQTKKILAILAHPDDESFGMGGTLAKYSHQGWQVSLLCATRGEAGIPGVLPEVAGTIRERELQQAARHLSISVDFLGYIDGTLANMDPKQLLDSIVSSIDEKQPDIILTFGPDGISGHPDHVSVSYFVTKAVKQYFPNVSLLYLAPSEATLLGCGVSAQNPDPGKATILVDVSDFKIEKIKAIQSHASQNPSLTKKAEEEVDQIACSEFFMVAQTGNNLQYLLELENKL